MDAVLMGRIQFAFTALYHYLFVPLSVGFGLILAILVTKAYKTKNPKDEALASFWLRLFIGTFAVGVATGITMEFSFGTNWADYSRFVGDIFGAPLAAEALFAFFMESVFLGVLAFGKKKVGPKFYVASSWLVWAGSCLSCLWIIIANSWMQTPAGYEVTDGRATLTDFFQAAINYSTGQRYLHVIVALLLVGALAAIAIAAYYKLKGRAPEASKKLMKAGTVIAVVCAVFMMFAAHQQACEVAQQQPAKLAAMEGQWEDGPAEMSLFGWVDEDSGTTYTIGIPGLTSFVASGSFDTSYPGLNSLSEDEYTGNINAIYQCYHFMLYMFGLVIIVIVLSLLVMLGKLKNKWVLRLLVLGPLFALLAIEFGWMVTELGRQPWIVYGQMLTSDAYSLSVEPWMLIVTIVLFVAIYVLIYFLWLRSSFRTIKKGPEAFLPAESNSDQEEVSEL